MALSSEPNDQDATPPKPTEDQLRLARAALNPLTDMQRRAVIAVVAYETVQELVAPSEQSSGPEMTPEQLAVAREYLRSERAIGWKDLPLIGRRRPDQIGDALPGDLQFGDFWRADGVWTAYVPGGPVSPLPNHHVEEHEDGTITVEPGGGGLSNSIPGHRFHGWIRRGVWTST